MASVEPFDTVIERRNTNSVKWDYAAHYFGLERGASVQPMWVADMDFPAPEAVYERIRQRAAHGIYGYAAASESLMETTADWFRRRHEWSVHVEWLYYACGVVPSMGLMVQAFTAPGDKILIQSPVYPPFFQLGRMNGRELVINELVQTADGSYEMDFDQLEQQFAAGVNLFLFCNPHNPIGRSWNREELEKLAGLCLRYDVRVVSDEIWCDLVWQPNRHIPLASLDPAVAARSCICTAPSKTFNIAGLNTSVVIVPDAALRKQVIRAFDSMGLDMPNLFGLTAAEAAYGCGAGWLDALKAYIQSNLEYLENTLAEYTARISLVPVEATYLAWLDCRGLGYSDPAALERFFITEAGVALNSGHSFGPGGSGFMRMNTACPRVMLKQGLDAVLQAIDRLDDRTQN